VKFFTNQVDFWDPKIRSFLRIDNMQEELRTISENGKKVLPNSSGNGHSLMSNNAIENNSYIKKDDEAVENKKVEQSVKTESLKVEAELLQAEEESIERRYKGWRATFRLLEVSYVIGMLSLFLYLDQSDIHRKHHLRQAEARMEIARRLTWFAIFGEKFHWIRLKLFHALISLLYKIFIGKDKQKAQEKQALWLQKKLIRLGPTFIKIGQALGTRADLLPLPFVETLGELQDNVPPFPNEVAFARIERELGKKISEVYSEFEPEPIAAASLGQVYRARLITGEEVAVKVQRPNLAGIIKGDIEILRKIVNLSERFPSLTANADWKGMLEEFEATINEEMNYVAEAHNAERFRHNFRDWKEIHVPKIYWQATTSKVLTMEFIRGTKVVDLDELRARGIAPEKVNRLLIRTYLKQLLEDGFFHADPHPGNLLVMRDGRLAFFDFGMVGHITPKLQAKMIDAFFHVVGKDPAGVAQDLIDLNFLKPGVNPEIVRPVVEKIFRYHLNLKLKDVKFKELTYELADVMYDYPFRLPSNFTYIMRALMTLEGIGIITDPEFNFFETAKPYAKEFMLRREGRELRKTLVDKILGRDAENGKIDLERTWKLAKMALKTLWERASSPEK
jgi:predicted unusual protein kinase regulating ubiquinone biosynthesis (AarF/ABC1/UbiB family)